MSDYKIYKPTKKEIGTLKKFALICDRMFIEPDRISVVNGRPDNQGKTANITKMACLELEHPHNFDEKFGLYSIGEFLNIVDMLDNFEVRVYEKYILIMDLDNNFKIQMFLTPEEHNIIPFTDIMAKYDKAYNNPKVARFNVDWSVIKTLSAFQKKLNKKFMFIGEVDDGNMRMVVGNSFKPTANENNAVINITTETTEITNNLPAIQNGGFSKFVLDTNTLIEDTYEITVLERAIILKGLTENNKYMFLTLFQN